ncbi:MAG: aromatic ring-hydroxylating dioxygenase subunit alpha [Pseudomonadota bacterium]
MLKRRDEAAGLDCSYLSELTKKLDDFAKPSKGLDDACYVDHDWFALERQALFADQWIIAGFSHEMAKIGMLKPVDLMGTPILIVRDKQGKLQVFENICKHRGMILVEKETSLKSNMITCPYHAWGYGLDGCLKKTPHIGGANCHDDKRFDKDKINLKKIRHYEWMGIIFVNLSGHAIAFEQKYSTLIDRWSAFKDQDLYHCGQDSTIIFELNSNWKLPVENYCESYHLPMVHPSLNQYSKLEDHYDIVESGLFSGQGSHVYDPRLSNDGLFFANATGLPSSWMRKGEYVALYPNLLLGIHRDHFYAVWIEPMGPLKTRERMEIFYFDPQADRAHMKKLRNANQEMWRGIFREDVKPVEGMQKGRYGRYFDGGVLTPEMDRPTRCFLSWVASHCADAM